MFLIRQTTTRNSSMNQRASVFLGLGCVLFFGVPSVMLLTNSSATGKPGSDKELQDLRKEIRDLKQELEDVTVKRQLNERDIGLLSQRSPHVGSIMAFASDWPPRKQDGSVWK